MTGPQGPFRDPHFHAVVTALDGASAGSGWKRRGRPVDWTRADARGIGNDDVDGLPAGMPFFRYGRDADGEFLSVAHDGHSYSNRNGEIVVSIRTILPETLRGAVVGRPLRDLVRLPGLDQAVVAEVLEGADVGPGAGLTSFRLTP